MKQMVGKLEDSLRDFAVRASGFNAQLVLITSVVDSAHLQNIERSHFTPMTLGILGRT